MSERVYECASEDGDILIVESNLHKKCQFKIDEYGNIQLVYLSKGNVNILIKQLQEMLGELE